MQTPAGNLKGGEFRCDVCNQYKPTDTGHCGTGYATNDAGEFICYQCCADLDRKQMQEGGNSRSIPLYLTHEPFQGRKLVDGVITNWPGTLRFTARVKKGQHNIAGSRYDAWFNGPDGHVWHGVLYGENTQIIHCKRTKQTT